MNKIFKVVWSKTKECYVVVSEVAKNNGGKKKVLASVLAGLAMVGAGTAGTPVQAGGNYGNSAVNIAPDNLVGSNYANAVSKNSVVVGYQNDSTGGPNNESGKIIYGANNTANRESSLAVGNQNTASNKSTSAIGVGNTASGEASVALGNANTASGDRSVAIGSGATASAANTISIGRSGQASKDYAVSVGFQSEASDYNAVAIGRQSKAKAISTVSIGVVNEVTGERATAVGNSNTVAGNNAAAFGRDNKANGVGNSVVGLSNTTNGEYSSAIGYNNTVSSGGAFVAGVSNTTSGDRNVAIGNENTTSGQDSVGIGSKVTVGSGWSIAIGSNFVDETTGIVTNTIANGNAGNKADGTKKPAPAIAIGAGAQAVANPNGATGLVAIGQLAKATHNNTIAFGTQAEATANNATAVGSTAQAMGASSAAFGTQAVANGLGATAFGPGASAGTGSASGAADGSVAVGRKATVTATGGVGIGWASAASEKNATAIGFSATASGVQSVAIGGGDDYDYPGTERGKHFTTASGKSSVAVGSYAKATEENAMAFGTDANANIAGGVALGSESKTTVAAGVQGYNPASDRTDKYSTQAGAVGTSTLAAVSIGDGSAKTRQLTGLAAGTADTDAVNVAQLKNVNLKYAGDTGNSDVLLKDHTLNVKGSDFITTSADGTGITVKAKIGDAITANTDGKAVAPATNGLATTTNVADAINASGWKVTSSNNGGTTNGSSSEIVSPGGKVTFSAGKNIVLDQAGKQFTYSLNKDVDLTKDGSLTIGDTKIINAGMTITGGPSITKTGIDAGSKKITNVTAGTADTDAVNVKQLKDTEKHIKPGTYAVANDGSVTLKYVDGNGTEQTETAKITGIAKKSKVINGQNTTVEEGTDTTDNSVTYKVNVKGDLADISSITNGTGSGKISFEGDQVVKVGGDHPISFDGKGGYVTGLQNKDWDITNPTVVSGRAATEDQLKKVSDGFNNTVKLTGNSGATGTQKLNQNGGLSFGVVGADNGKYITTTASGSNVVADLSTDAKAKLNSKVVVAGSGAATVAAPTVTTNADGSTVTTYTVHVDPATATAASTESVVKKAVTGDTNIADVSVADGKATGDVGAKYEVSVSRNAVKDAAREAVTVNNGGTTKADGSYTADSNNPISVTPTKDDNNHNTSYAVTFDGNKAAKQIPLTYKATNGTTTSANQTVTLDKGLNFTGGDYTTASVGADGKVTFDVNLGTTPTVTDGKPGVPGQAGAAGKDGIATVKTVVDTINNSGWKANAKANGGKLDGSATATVVKPGNTVNYAAGKNLIVNQELEKDASNALTGNQTYTYSLNKDIDLTNAGSLTVGDTTVNNGGITIKAPTPAAGTTATTTDVKLTNTGLNNGGNTITNVAEGQNNTDAVNVKQLKANRTEVKAGDNVVVTSAVDATDNHTIYTVNAVTPAVYTTPDGTKLTKDKDGKFHKESETAEYTGDIITSFENPKAATGQTTKDGGMIVNNIGSAIKNQTPTMPAGQTATYLDKLKAAADAGSNVKNAAVNVSDLHNTANALRDNELHIAPTAVKANTTEVKGGSLNAAGTENVYKYDAATKKVILTYNDGNGKAVTDTKAVIDFSALNTGGTTASTWTAKTSAENTTAGSEVGKHAGDASQVIGNQNSVDFQAGRNMTVTQTNDGSGNTTINYALDKDLTNLDKVVVNGKDGQAGRDGVTIVGPQGATGTPGTNGIDGKVGITGKDGKDAVSISGKDGVGHIGLTGPQGPQGPSGTPGTPGANIDISTDHGTQTLVKPEANNNNQSERIVYVPKDSQGNPLKDTDGKNIVREVATMDDGLKFTGNNTTIENKQKLGSLVKVQGEGTKEGTTVINTTTGEKEIVLSDGTTKFESAKDNIAVVADGTDTLTVKLNKNLKGLDSVQTKTVELGDHTTPGGTTNITYNTGDKRIEYTTPGATAGSTETKKVATTDDIWTIQGNGTDVKPVNGKVNVKAGENILITTPATADGSMTINAVTPAVYTDKDGNKLTKDKDGKFHKDDGTEIAAADVITSIQDAAGHTTGGNSIVNNVGSAINNHATPGVTSPTYLDKLDAAAGDTKTQNAAVNVTDLKNTADGLTDKGLKFDANEGGVKTNKLGSTVTVQGSGALTAGKAYADEYNTANIRTNISQSNGDTVINVGLAKALKDINSISNGGSSITLNSTPGGATNIPAVQITGGNLSMGDGTANGNNKIVNLAPGTADTDAVNVKQLKDTELHITPGTYTPDTNKKVKLTYTDGNGALVSGKEAVIDLSGLSTGGATASTWNVKSSANTTDGGAVGATHNANAQNIANGKTVEFQSGKNLVVNQTNDTTNGNATVEFSLSDNITVGKDGANGKNGSVGAKGADGSAVVMNGADGSIGLNGTNGANGISIKGKDGTNGVGIDGKDGVTRIVYTEKVPDPATGTTKEVTHEVATMDDGLRFTGNNTSTENKRKLGSLVKVQGEGTKESAAADPATGKKYVVLSDGTTKFESAQDNIAVEADGTDTLTVKLNKNLKGLNSIQLGDNTIKSDGDTIKFDTKNSGTKTVATTDQLWTIQAGGVDVPAKSGKVNLVAGDHITITPDAANGKMTISATGFGSMDGFNVKSSASTGGTHAGDTTENIKNGKTVDMQAGKNLVVTQTNDGNGNTTVNYALNKDVDLGTNGSLKTGATTIDDNGFKNGNTTVGGNGMTIKDPTDPAKTVSLTKDGLNNGGNQITNVASGGNVDTNAANIGDIKRLAKDTRIKDGTYTVDNNGTVELTYVDGAGNQVKDASGNAITAKITGLTTLDSTRVNVAVNETGSGKAVGSTAPVKVTKGTEFVAGDNLIVERKAHTGNDLDNSVVYSLNSNLTGITSISNAAGGPKMTFGGNNVNFTGGDVKISNGNLDMNKNKITNVANGTDPHDAVNVSQLKAAKTIVEAADTSVTVTKDAGAGANGEDIYKIKANPAGTVDLTNVNNRVDQLGEEIGRVGAQGAALSALKPIQYDPLEPTQIMAGYGNYRGNSAVALGVAHYKNESTLIHGGVSWAGGSSHMMANAGVTWKVGNRDSEAAVADRYRKGPISSAYAMQQEMAAMKAQNAGLKGEVSDLKAENEQMKAQIAAMMAKLGL